MVFNSLTFVVFFACVLVLHAMPFSWLTKKRNLLIASYLFYSFAGGGIKPHVDTEVFSVNLMLMLKHVTPEGQEPSRTVYFPADRAPISYSLQVGEVMLSHGSSIIHARSIVKENEDVALLTIGFNRIT